MGFLSALLLVMLSAEASSDEIFDFAKKPPNFRNLLPPTVTINKLKTAEDGLSKLESLADSINLDFRTRMKADKFLQDRMKELKAKHEKSDLPAAHTPPRTSLLETRIHQKSTGRGKKMQPESLIPVAQPRILKVMTEVGSLPDAAADVVTMPQQVITLPESLPAIPAQLPDLFPGHRPLHGLVFHPVIDNSLATPPIGSVMNAEDMHAGLDAIALDKKHLEQGLLTEVENLGMSPKTLRKDMTPTKTVPSKTSSASPGVGGPSQTGDQALAELDKLLGKLNNKQTAPERTSQGMGSTRFSQVEQAQGVREGGKSGVEQAAFQAQEDAESAISDVENAMGIRPDSENAMGHLPHYGTGESISSSPASQQTKNRDASTDFLVAQGVVNPYYMNFMQKPAKKLPLNIRDEQVVSQTFAKAQSTLGRLQRTAYGMAQQVRALNMVEMQLQRTLGYLGDQEFYYGAVG